MTHDVDVVCLGGGVAAEALASGLRDSTLRLAVVERALVGGECPYWGCIPSKALLRAGETLSEADRARTLAASRVEWTVDFPKVAARVRRAARGLDDSGPAMAIEAAGARLIRGEGHMADLRTVIVGDERLVARRAIVIATGSTPAIPSIPGLDAVDFWTNRQAAIPDELPATLSVGLSEAAALAKGLDIIVAGAEPGRAARGYVHGFSGGIVKLVADRERGVLVGAALEELSAKASRLPVSQF